MGSGDLQVAYVELLDEGTETYRPVIVSPLADGRFKILEMPEYRLLEERWAVEPGTIVTLQNVVTFGGNEIPVAIAAGGQNQIIGEKL